MPIPEDDATRHLSAEALRLYGAIAAQQWDTAGAVQADNPNARQELLAWGLISDEERPVARDPQHALRTMVSRELEKARQHIDLVATMPDLSRDLIREYRQVQLRAGDSSVYLADQDTVNTRLKDVVGGARREILAAQPGGPRSRELLEIAVARDTAALDRGVDLRTIYRDTVRDHAVTAEYARTMSARTAGRPAQYRTLVGDFERMVIVDREQAVVSDHIVAGSPPHAAWLVTDPAVVAVLARVFEATWRRAQPWCGELTSRTGGVDTVSGMGGVRTDRRQRGILRYLCAGESQPATARKMGVSKRSLESEISVLKGRWGVRTLNELIFQYALSPDRLIDDTDHAPGAGEGGEQAVA
ncbi:hypothetical protein [Streptomyces sp. AS02]|uniref:hypothetical protein n=1 Tax=Streptomyces sp. AS02 TaxID=2938946 RepID=UPI0020209DF7|nr:hypothetical protein [Streptomyces sp. AS02]MCL8016898.1 hypothetical protein [Streptomyces sp. AS02]